MAVAVRNQWLTPCGVEVEYGRLAISRHADG